MAKKRLALVIAASVEVCCPWCGEPQPDPETGSHLWEPKQLRAAVADGQTVRSCVSCDERLILHAPTRLSMTDA